MRDSSRASNVQCSATFSYALFMNGSLLAPHTAWRRPLSVDKCSSLMTYAEGPQMHRTRRHVRRWPMVMIRHTLPHGARKRASYVEGCAAACGDSASRFRPPKAPQPDEQ